MLSLSRRGLARSPRLQGIATGFEGEGDEAFGALCVTVSARTKAENLHRYDEGPVNCQLCPHRDHLPPRRVILQVYDDLPEVHVAGIQSDHAPKDVSRTSKRRFRMQHPCFH